jgi:hypothetical protein
MSRSRLLRAVPGSAVAYPNAATTGPAAGGYGTLTPVSGGAFNIFAGSPGSWPSWVQTLGDGSQLVSGIAFGAGTTFDVTVANIAFAGCTILCAPNSRAITSSGTNVTARWCTIGPQDTTPLNRMQQAIDGDSLTGGITVDHCNFYGWEQALHCANTTTVTSSYIHDPVYLGGDHTECFEMPGGTTLTVANSTITNSQGQTAVIAAGTSPASYTVTGSLIGGGGYTFYSYTSASDIIITGNSMTTAYFPACGSFGMFDDAPTWGSSGNVWSGNVWADGPSAGQAVPHP